jgi:hypothetical protein
MPATAAAGTTAANSITEHLLAGAPAAAFLPAHCSRYLQQRQVVCIFPAPAAPCSQVPEVDALVKARSHALQHLGRVEALQLVGCHDLAQLGMDGTRHATWRTTARHAMRLLLLLLHCWGHHATWW